MLDQTIRRLLSLFPKGATDDQLIWRLCFELASRLALICDELAGKQVNATSIAGSSRRQSAPSVLPSRRGAVPSR